METELPEICRGEGVAIESSGCLEIPLFRNLFELDFYPEIPNFLIEVFRLFAFGRRRGMPVGIDEGRHAGHRRLICNTDAPFYFAFERAR